MTGTKAAPWYVLNVAPGDTAEIRLRLRHHPTPESTFGLGEARRADRVVVHWPSGKVSRFQGIEAGRQLIVEEANELGDLCREMLDAERARAML